MYLGGLLAIATFPLWQTTPMVSLAVGVSLLLPGGIDGVTQMFGRRESTNGLRAVTGILLGVGVVTLVYNIVVLLI